jgi:hypothetical protein
MSTEKQYRERYEALTDLLRRWDRRWRVQQTLAWLARGLIPGLALGIILMVISRFYPFLTGAQIGFLALVGLVLGLAGLLLFIWLRPHPLIELARRFDHDFGLQERVSTALELMDGRIRARDALTIHQLDDAYARARSVPVRERLPLAIRRGDWAVVGAMALILGALLALPGDPGRAAVRDDDQQQAVAAAADEVRDTIEELAADTTLDEDLRESLLETLQTSLETLQDESITIDEALATLSDIEQLLSESAAGLEELAAQQQDALRAAFEALADPSGAEGRAGEGVTREGQALSGDQPLETLDDLMQRLQQMTPQEVEAAADRLENLADMLERLSPEAADALREAAEALRDGDQAAADEALRRAAEHLQQAQEDASQAAEQLQQAAEQFGEAQEQLAAGDQDGDDGAQAGAPGEEETGDGQPSPGMQPLAGDTEGDPDGMQAGAPSEQSQQGVASDGDAPTDDTSGSPQIGSQPGDLGSEAASFAETGDAPEGGGPQGGERPYEEVFAPRRPEIEPSDTDIILQPDAGDTPLIEGFFAENPAGQVTVPYNQVYGEYAEAANQALNRGYIPLGLRDVVREYFTSLAPRGSISE